MVDFQGRHRAGGLTSPAIAAEDLLPQPIVRRGIQPIAGRIGPHLAHDAFSPRPSRKVRRCSPGKNLKNLVIENSNVAGSPLSKLAAARKSAQIISKSSSRAIGFPALGLPSRLPAQ